MLSGLPIDDRKSSSFLKGVESLSLDTCLLFQERKPRSGGSGDVPGGFVAATHIPFPGSSKERSAKVVILSKRRFFANSLSQSKRGEKSIL